MGARSMGSAIAAALLVGLIASGLAAAGPPGGGHWTFAGQGLTNTRYQNSEHKLGVGNVALLQPKWVFTAGSEVSATPAVDGQNVYFPDWAGNLYAVDRATGAQVWSRSLATVTGVPGDRARATPALAGGKLFIGNQGTPLFLGGGGGGKMLAFDAKTGAHLWTTVLDTNRAAIITQSATVHAGVVYVGVSSNEEAFSAFFPGYVCCTFRGSMYALNADTGQVIWKTTMVPAGYPGGAVWGSSPALDLKRGQVYIATGNNYDVPDSALACIEAAGDDPIAQQACIPADNLMDSILALDMRTGQIRWVTKALTFDAAGRRSSSARVRRAASTGPSTPTPVKWCGGRLPGRVAPRAGSSGARRSTAPGSTRRTRTATLRCGRRPAARPRASGAGSTLPRASSSGRRVRRTAAARPDR